MTPCRHPFVVYFRRVSVPSSHHPLHSTYLWTFGRRASRVFVRNTQDPATCLDTPNFPKSFMAYFNNEGCHGAPRGPTYSTLVSDRAAAKCCRLLAMQHYRSCAEGPPWSAWQLVSHASTAVSFASWARTSGTARPQQRTKRCRSQ